MQATVWSQAEGDFGPRWQTNAMAVLSGVADPGQYDAIWTHALSQVGQSAFRPNLITPYYGAYVLDAMAKMNHRADALKWIREYWGGMIDEGATSFWEATKDRRLPRSLSLPRRSSHPRKYAATAGLLRDGPEVPSPRERNSRSRE